MEYFFPVLSLSVLYALIFHSIFIAYMFILLTVTNFIMARFDSKRIIKFIEIWNHLKRIIKIKTFFQLILTIIIVSIPGATLGALIHESKVFPKIIVISGIIAIIDAVFVMPMLLIKKRKLKLNEPFTLSFIVFDSIVWSIAFCLILLISI